MLNQQDKSQQTTTNETSKIQTPTKTLWHINTESKRDSQDGNWWKRPHKLRNLDPDRP